MDFSPEAVLQEVRSIVTQQQEEFDAIYKNQILPELAQHNIYLIRPKDLRVDHHVFLDKFFSEKLIQHVQPILLVKNKIRTFLPSNAIHLAVRLRTMGNLNRYAVVKIPSDTLPRFIELPSRNDRREIILLDDI